MVADGTSFSTISLARWYQRIEDPQSTRLSIDPYLCGSIVSFCSNAPIGDSAPTTSCYMTGIPSIQGFVSTYPYATEQDLVSVDDSKAYSPVLTLWEAARLAQQRKVGIVVTCEFPHATPADCIAHSYNRSKYDWIVPQMLHGQAHVLIGGGVSLLNDASQTELKNRGYQLILNDRQALLNHKDGGNLIALFSPMDMPYDLDRDPAKTPSLAEMTRSAIEALDGGEEGFVLLVEGSKIDWAAHANDPVAMATEYLAFDRAVAVALQFAEADGETAVIVTTDHGNSGLSIGHGGLKDYAGASMSELFGPLTKIKKTSQGLADELRHYAPEQFAALFKQQTQIDLTEEELQWLPFVGDYQGSPLSKEERKAPTQASLRHFKKLSQFIAQVYRSRMFLGFTTDGHTGEELFLASYLPTQFAPMRGVYSNIDLHHEMRKLLGFTAESWNALADQYYVPHTELFARGYKVTITGTEPQNKKLCVQKGKQKLEIQAFTDRALFNNQWKPLSTPAVYVDKVDCFFIDREVAAWFR